MQPFYKRFHPFYRALSACAAPKAECVPDAACSGPQVEYLWPPCSYLELTGAPYLVEGMGSFLTMLPVHINANGKAMTCEELLMVKKDIHLNAFRCIVDELQRDLVRICVVDSRLSDDGYLRKLVIGRWKGTHRDWQDFVVIADDGSFHRGSGDCGKWKICLDDSTGTVILSLVWDRLGTEEMYLVDQDLIGSDRIVFRNAVLCKARFTLTEFEVRSLALALHKADARPR